LITDYRHIDTTPGAGTFLSPPSDWNGDYRALMRERYASIRWGQQFLSCAWQSHDVTIRLSGSYSSDALALLKACGAKADKLINEQEQA